jgi:hypothetical protein
VSITSKPPADDLSPNPEEPSLLSIWREKMLALPARLD